MRRVFLWTAMVTAAAGWGAGDAVVVAQSSLAPSARIADADVAAAIAALSADDFSARQEARRRLEAWVADAAAATRVRATIEAHRAQDSLSFEARAALEELARRWSAPPETEPAVEGKAPAEARQLDVWLTELDSDDFVRREAAGEALAAAAADARTAHTLLHRLQARLADGRATFDALKRIDPLWEAAWRTWLLTDPAQATVPDVAEADIAAAVVRLGTLAPQGGAAAVAQRVAERQLLYWMAFDALLPRVVEPLRKRLLDREQPPAVRDAAARLLSWTRPAMVAEIWNEGQLGTVQHLLIGVPNQPLRAPNPSLFDRCTDESGHCVSGNLLTPGDYPVGVFFRPPDRPDGAPPPDLMFHLVNLPTPRRRLAYEAEVPILDNETVMRRVDVKRRRRISARTIDRFLAEKRLLTVREIEMLMHLDPDELARMAGPYLSDVADARAEEEGPSLHTMYCFVLARSASSSAGPALAEAIDRARVLPPTFEAPVRMDWLAALHLANRAPWPGLDAWLAAQVDRRDPLDLNTPAAADAGASAAALLVRRASEAPSMFGLERVPGLFDGLDDVGFRFSRPAGRDEVRAWWQKRHLAEPKSPVP